MYYIICIISIMSFLSDEVNCNVHETLTLTMDQDTTRGAGDNP